MRPSTREGGGKGPAFKPQLLVCYLCGQQFGTSSLGIHVPQCYTKKRAQWEAGDPSTRGKAPKHPDTVNWQANEKSIQEQNDEQYSEFSNNLEPCPNCGRKFLPDRLVVHLRSCGNGSGSKPIRGKEGDRPASQSGGRPSTRDGGGGGGKGPAFKPQLLVCYLCGQQFGTSSLNIHVPQCYTKKRAQWEAGDPSTRGKAPKHPDTVNWQSNEKSIQEQNDEQYSEFSNNLEPCPNCGRKFLPDRLVVHLRSCKPGGGSRPITRGESTNPSASPNQRLGGTSSASPPPTRAGVVSSGVSNNNNNSQPTVVPKKLPPKLRALQRVLFEDCDVNRDGYIDLNELRILIRGVAGEESAKEAEELMNSLDLNGDGVIDPTEWARMANATGESLQPLKNRLPPGKSSAPGKRCVKCNAVEYDARSKFCRDCGAPFGGGEETSAATTTSCQSCGESYPVGSRFCPTCGVPVNHAAPERATGTLNENGTSMKFEPCRGCGAVCDSDTNFCDNCGAVLGNEDDEDNARRPPPAATTTSNIPVRSCISCGIVYEDPEVKFCEECGAPLKEREPVRPPPQPPTTSSPGTAAGNKRWNDGSAPPAQKDLPKIRGAPATAAGQQPPSNRSPQSVEERSRQPPPVDDDGDQEDDTRVPCEYCGRRFNPESLDRHMNFCQRQNSSSRKVFDSRKARMQGTEAQGYIRKVSTEDSRGSKPQAPKKDWKTESEAFRRALREARVVDQVLKAGGTAKDLPPPTYSENAHYVPCPHCGRRFAPDTAERHIPKCATTINKPKAPPRRR